MFQPSFKGRFRDFRGFIPVQTILVRIDASSSMAYKCIHSPITVQITDIDRMAVIPPHLLGNVVPYPFLCNVYTLHRLQLCAKHNHMKKTQ